MNTAQTASPAQQSQTAARNAAWAAEAEAEEDSGFGWLASSLELKVGLLVQYLRIDPTDADWRGVFSPA